VKYCVGCAQDGREVCATRELDGDELCDVHFRAWSGVPPVEEKSLAGEPVRMTPGVVMGPEMIAPGKRGSAESTREWVRAVVREHAGKLSDSAIGKLAGVSSQRVQQIRKEEGLPAAHGQYAPKAKKAAAPRPPAPTARPDPAPPLVAEPDPVEKFVPHPTGGRIVARPVMVGEQVEGQAIPRDVAARLTDNIGIAQGGVTVHLHFEVGEWTAERAATFLARTAPKLVEVINTLRGKS
jgi:hypothetical protein